MRRSWPSWAPLLLPCQEGLPFRSTHIGWLTRRSRGARRQPLAPGDPEGWNRTADGWEAFVRVTTAPGTTYVWYVLARDVRPHAELT